MEQNTNYQALREVISQCTTQLTNIDHQQQEYHIQRRTIEEHFERCIHALEARRADLLSQFDVLKDKNIEAIQAKIATHVSICQDILKAGSNVYNTSSASADLIWQEALKLEKPSVDATSSIDIVLPDILNMLTLHGSVSATANLSISKRVRDYSTPKFARVDRVETFAGGMEGFQDGKGTDAQFKGPRSLCFNPHDYCLYVCDYANNMIRKISLNGHVETFVDIDHPTSIVMNYQEKCFYVTNIYQNTITKISISGNKNIYVGHKLQLTWLLRTTKPNDDGVGTSAYFNRPEGLAIDQQSGTLFVCDRENHLIRKISSQGAVTTLAGSHKGFSDGPGDVARFCAPRGICFDEQDQSVVVSDCDNDKIRRVKLNGEVSTICAIPSPTGIAIANDRSLIVSSFKHRIFRVHQEGEGYKIEMLAGCGEKAKRDGTPAESAFDEPQGIAIHPSYRACFIADFYNHAIRKISFDTPGQI